MKLNSPSFKCFSEIVINSNFALNFTCGSLVNCFRSYSTQIQTTGTNLSVKKSFNVCCAQFVSVFNNSQLLSFFTGQQFTFSQISLQNSLCCKPSPALDFVSYVYLLENSTLAPTTKVRPCLYGEIRLPTQSKGQRSTTHLDMK